MPRITNLALLGVWLFVSCVSPPGEEQAARKASSGPSIEGVVWRWAGLTGPDALEVDRPGLYTISLDAQGGYAIRADCNRGSGTYTIEGGALELSPGPMTLAACPAGSQADRFLASLGQVSGHSRDGDRLTLTLADAAGAMEFVAPKPVELAGTSWLVRAADNGKQGVASVLQGSRLSAAFGVDGTLSGSAGCNSYSGSYSLDGDGISVGPAAVTRKMCAQPEGVMEQEAAFVAALATAANYHIEGNRLQLRTADGALAVDLVAAVTGTVAYRVRRALPPEARILVQLQDVSLADAPAVLLGEQTFEAAGKQVPFSFEVPFDPSDIDPRHSYNVRATIRGPDGSLMFSSTAAHPVITGDHPTLGVEIQLQPVGDHG